VLDERPSTPRVSPFGLAPEDLATRHPPNDPAFLFRRIFRVRSWRDGLPDLGNEGRAHVAAHYDFSLPEVVARSSSEDGSTKLLLKLVDGAEIEVVHMPRAVKNPRVTLCISSQVGCGMGCRFCATATMGFRRQLTAAEIVAQVLVAVRELGPEDSTRITIVFMGMGEPLQNLPEVSKAIALLADERGLGIPVGRITVSTSGLVPQIDALAQLPVRPCLALSLNATTDATRSAIMPVGKTWNLQALREALLRFPLRSHEKITLEYVLLAGVNDSDDDAARLVEFATGFRHVVNVIPWNAWEGVSYTETSEDRLQAFVKKMQDAGVLVTVRRSRGRDVAAACGQLVRTQEKSRRSPRLPVAP